MGEAFLCKRGSGSAETAVSACGFVCASVPQGSSCSCIQGDKRFSVDNAPGLVAFAVPACGAWTVTISDGTRSKSGTVNILSTGDVGTITLDYAVTPPTPQTVTKTLLSPQSGLASGCSVNGNAAFNGSTIRETDGGGFWLSPAINLTNYTTLTVSGMVRAVSYGYSRISVGSTTEKVFSIAQTPECFAEWSGLPDAEYTVSINIAALTGSYYIGSTAVGNNLEITRIELT